MDNLTHSLIGYALARSLPERAAEQPAGLARARVWAAVVGSNLPDLDFLVGQLSDNSKLGYLLHHRGHTHTLLFALLASWPLGSLCARFVGAPVQRRTRFELWALSVAALLLHIGFDALNDYGVHPFFPLDNHWYYGDSVFIIEPLWWVSLGAFLAQRARSRFARGLGVAVGLLAITLGLLVPGVPRAVPAVCAVFGVALYLRFGAPSSRRYEVWLALGAVLLSFVGAGRSARAQALHAFGAQVEQGAPTAPSWVSSSPSPGNPLCWTVWLAELHAQTLVMQRVQLSLWPQVIGPEACSRPTTAAVGTAPESRPLPAAQPFARVTRRVELSLPELRALAASDCEARALLQFARLPFLAHTPEGDVLGDLRYDHEPELGFAELPLQRGGGACPTPSAPWVTSIVELL